MLKSPSVTYGADGAGGGGSGTPSSSGAPSDSGSSSSAPSAPTSPSGSPTSSPTSGAASGATPAGSGATATPSQSPPATGTPASGGDAFGDFPNLGMDSEDVDDAISADAAPPAVEPAPTPPVEATAPQPAVEGQPQPQAPAATPPQGQQGVSPPPSPAEPGRLAEMMASNHDALLQQMQSEFALSQEDAEALETNAIEAVPKLLAKVYLKSQMNMFNQLAKIVPAMMQAQQTRQQTSQKNEDRFWQSWPDLDPAKHGDVLKKYAPIYRQANPEASLETMVKDLGPIVMAAAGVVAGTGRVNGNGAQPPVVRVPPSPFKPALPGAAAIPTQTPDNPWEGLNPALDQEDS